VLAGTATFYLVDGREDYIVRAPGDVDAVEIDATHRAILEESFATERVPLSSTPAWPELSELEFHTDG
jgi:plasmid stability protein